jgi:hypothetical protein
VETLWSEAALAAPTLAARAESLLGALPLALRSSSEELVGSPLNAALLPGR